MRKTVSIDYDWDIKIVYTLRTRTKLGIGVDGVTDMGHKFQTTHKCSWRRFKKNLKYIF